MEQKIMKLDNEDKAVQKNVDELFGRIFEGFKPVAYYDENLDCVRVLVRDCSITETRINENLTLLEDNYPEKRQARYVGFTIKGAKHFCIKNGLTTAGPITVSEILTAMVDHNPEIVVDIAVSIALPILEESDIDKIEFSEAA